MNKQKLRSIGLGSIGASQFRGIRVKRTPAFATNPSNGAHTSFVQRPPFPMKGRTSGSQSV